MLNLISTAFVIGSFIGFLFTVIFVVTRLISNANEETEETEEVFNEVDTYPYDEEIYRLQVYGKR